MVICFEGISCSGKTSLILELSKVLKNVHIINELPDLSGKNITDFNSFCRENDIKKIKEALKESKNGKTVLLDRSYISTLAYNFIELSENKTNNEYIKTLNWYINNRNLLSRVISKFFLLNMENPDLSIKRAKEIGRYNYKYAWFRKPAIGQDFYHTFFKFIEPTASVTHLDSAKKIIILAKEVLKSLHKL